MILLPPIKVQIGLPLEYDIVWQEDGVGVNMTGWVGAVTFKRNFGDDDTLLTITPALGAAGEIAFDLTAEQTQSLIALEKQGYCKTGYYQISVTNGSEGQIFQGDIFTGAAL